MEKTFSPCHPTLVAHSGETYPVPMAHESVLMESTPLPPPTLSLSLPHTQLSFPSRKERIYPDPRQLPNPI